ncbi:MAG: hypothetical protein AAF772_18855 [Acidobacteriota bacterium]
MHRTTSLAALLLLLTLLAAPVAAAPSAPMPDAPRVADWFASWWQSVVAWVTPEPTPPVDEQGIIIIIGGSTATPLDPPVDEQGIIIIVIG